MTQDKALEILLKKNKHIQYAMKRLMAWDENLSLNENAENMGLGWQAAYTMKTVYGLKSEQSTSRRGKHLKEYCQAKRMEAANKYKRLWMPTKTMEENAKKLGVSDATARHIAKRYSFQYLKITKRMARLVTPRESKHFDKIQALKVLKFNDAQIANVVGVSRERVRQILAP